MSLAAAVGRPDVHAGEVPVAYVQLQPEATVTEEALLAYAQESIGERAAVPKSIHVIDEQWFTDVTGGWQDHSVRIAVGDFDVDARIDVAFSHSEKPGYQVTWYSSDDPKAGRRRRAS